MDEQQEKPFDAVSIVLLVMIAATSDISDAVTVLVAAVPVVGQVAYFGNMLLISPIAWATIQTWFIMKMGFAGRIGLMNIAGGLGNMIGIPGSETVTVVAAIIIANHPKIAAVAEQVAIGAATGGAGAAAKGATAGAAAAKTGEAAAGTARAAKGARAAEAGTVREAAVQKEGAAGVERRAVGGEAPAEKEGARGTKLREAAEGAEPQEAPPKPIEEIPETALGAEEEPIEKAKREEFGFSSEEQLAKEKEAGEETDEEEEFEEAA